MGIVIEQRPSDFSGGALQALGNIGTSALDAAIDGIAASTKAVSIIDDGDKGIIDDGLKLFGGFERNTFELAKTEGKNLSGLFQNAAEYGSPTQLFKNYVGNAKEKDSPYNEVLKKLEDPQFKVSDGLANYAGKQISKTISGTAQKPGNDVLEKGIIIVNSKPGGLEDRSNFEQKQKGVIYSDSKPRIPGGVEEEGIIVIGGGRPAGVNNIPISQDSLIKLQKLDVAVKHQLDLYQVFNNSLRTY
jgi:hypothetical protein